MASIFGSSRPVTGRSEIIPVPDTIIDPLDEWAKDPEGKFFPPTFFTKLFLIMGSEDRSMSRVITHARRLYGLVSSDDTSQENADEVLSRALEMNADSFVNPSTGDMHGHVLPSLGAALCTGAISAYAYSQRKVLPNLQIHVDSHMGESFWEPNEITAQLAEINPRIEDMLVMAASRLRPHDDEAPGYMKAGAMFTYLGLEGYLNRFIN